MKIYELISPTIYLDMELKINKCVSLSVKLFMFFEDRKIYLLNKNYPTDSRSKKLQFI